MKVFGRATIQVDGETLNSYDGASIQIDGVRRNEVVGDQRIDYAEQRVAAMVECEIKLGQGLSLRTVADWAGVTVTFTTDVGQVYVLSNAWLEEPPRATGSADGGRIGLVFKANRAEEVT